MKCQYINVLQLHDPEFAPSISLLLDETIPAMIKCRDEHHWIKAIGITGYPLDVQYEILRRSRELQKQQPDFIIFDQSLTYCHCNLFDTSLFTSKTFKTTTMENDHDGSRSQSLSSLSSFADYCQHNQINLMAAAPLAMGLLVHYHQHEGAAGAPDWHPASTLLKQACAEAATISKNHNVNISSLATIYALAHESISCTLIGCKSIHQVDIALQAALRFHDNNNHDTIITNTITNNHNNIPTKLKQILTNDEWETLQILMDAQNGPFAKVWDCNQFDWDGKLIAQSFWKQIPGGTQLAENVMRQRTQNK